MPFCIGSHDTLFADSRRKRLPPSLPRPLRCSREKSLPPENMLGLRFVCARLNVLSMQRVHAGNAHEMIHVASKRKRGSERGIVRFPIRPIRRYDRYRLGTSSISFEERTCIPCGKYLLAKVSRPRRQSAHFRRERIARSTNVSMNNSIRSLRWYDSTSEERNQ
jgi:hypothetical protein